MNKSTGFWGERQISSEVQDPWQLGNVSIWCRSHTTEVWIAHKHGVSGANEPEQDTADGVPEDTAWRRRALKDQTTTVTLAPVFPDRSIVAKPEHPFSIAAGAKARIYVRAPVWIRIASTDSKRTVLADIPSVVLSNTWFGDFVSGELCYWLTSSARRAIEAAPERPYLAICPIHITNKADIDLDVEKLRLQVQSLSIFAAADQLWADETRVTYHGLKQNSEVKLTGKLSPEAGQAKLLSPPRVPIRHGFTAATFATLRNLPGLGLLTG